GPMAASWHFTTGGTPPPMAAAVVARTYRSSNRLSVLRRRGRCRRPRRRDGLRRLHGARWRYAPDRGRQIVGDNQRAFRIDRHTHRTTAGGAVVVPKPGNEIHRRAGRPPVAERHEHHLVADGLAAVPTTVFADENPAGELAAHRVGREIHAQRRDVRAQAVVGLDRRRDLFRVLGANPLVHVLPPIAVRPAI